jgi:calcineurin-like phosphoesterase family protein
MKTYMTSDIHWSHKRIIDFCPNTRSKYKTTENMDEQMIIEWNNTVQPDDVVYFLGDFAFCNAEKATTIAHRLNGKMHFVAGNHDNKTIRHKPFRDRMESVQDYLEIDYNGVKICMMHYPLASWNQEHRGAIMCHGHLHDSKSGLEEYRSFNVGFDYTGNLLTELDDIVRESLNRKIKKHHD